MVQTSEDIDISGLIQTLDTDLFADSVEWCPQEGFQHLLLCGTYQLDEHANKESELNEKSAQTRKGQLRVYHLDVPQDDRRVGLSLKHCLPMPGVLDIKWTGQTLPQPVFGLVNSTGHLQVWRVPSSNLDQAPVKLGETCLGDSCLGLSLDWTNTAESLQVVTSDSAGILSVYDVNNDVTKVDSWHAHDHEAWICAYDKWNPGVIYSGGDDSIFKGWDLRVGFAPVFTNSRHSMGVCSIQSNGLKEYMIAVGSYDEELHVWDTRHMKRPLAACDVGGGIWRVKWDPRRGERILTATMYNGFHIVDAASIDEGKCCIAGHFECGSHLGYGADWCRLQGRGRCPGPSQEDDSGYLIALCSFYNHQLQLRRWPT